MKHKEISACIDEIIEFSEIGKFVNTPVKRYSSGMYVRLAFAVAAHLDPDILLIDEVLAVGDMKFQRKCLERMGKVAQEGRTVVFVSHNIQAVSQLCDEALLLDHGELIASGKVKDVVEQYQVLNRIEGVQNGSFQYPVEDDAEAHIEAITIGPSDQPKLSFDILEPIDVEVEFLLKKDFENCILELGVYTLDGMCVTYSRELDGLNFRDHSSIRTISGKEGRYHCKTSLNAPLLNCGFYELRLSLTSPPQHCYHLVRGLQIEVTDHHGSYSSAVVKATAHGVVTQPLSWDRAPIR
jgi:lipopolysaccharide transport system ATP-binding protein